MNNFKVEINLNDLVEDMFVDAEIDEFGASPAMTFSDSIESQVISLVSNRIVKDISDDAVNSALSASTLVVNEFIEKELTGILVRKLRAGEIKTRYNGIKSLDSLIDEQISRINIEGVISRHIELKANKFAEEMKLRYDNVFAAKVVQGLAKQKMLDPNIAKVLLGE